MNTASCKAKGRNLQKWVVQQLIAFGIAPKGDVESRPMGSGGEDIIIGNMTRQRFPFSIECKNTEKLNVWNAYHQAVENSNGYVPLLIIKRNHSAPLAVVDATYFFNLIKGLNNGHA